MAQVKAKQGKKDQPSAVIQLGVTFVMVAAIVLFAVAFKFYTP